MLDNIDEVAEKRVTTLRNTEMEKLWVAKAYSRKIHPKDFHIDELVWKVILPIDWEGPF
jgi:hypothetical protein